MAIYKYGTFVQPTKGASAFITLNIGFIPSVFRMRDITVFTSGTVTGVIEGYFSQQLQATSTGSSLLYTYTTGALTPGISVSTTNGITAFTTPDAELFLPAQTPYTTSTRVVGESTNLVITGISQAANASITATHSFTSADVGVTVVTFHYVQGMTQINTLSGVIQTVTGTTSFTVNINTTNFSAYTSGGVANVITGAPATTLYGNTNLPTAEANLGIIGLKIGSEFMNGAGSNTGDIWEWEAILQSPATGP